VWLLAIGLITTVRAGFLQKDGYLTQDYVCLMRKGHPILKGTSHHVRKNFPESDHILSKKRKNTGAWTSRKIY